MTKTTSERKLRLSKIAISRFRHRIRRKRKKHRLWAGFVRYEQDVRRRSVEKKVEIVLPIFNHKRFANPLPPPPSYSNTIQHIATVKDAFGPKSSKPDSNGVFIIPQIFSLTEEQDKSYAFLRGLYDALYNQTHEVITLDYDVCKRIDLDASVCMDIILSDFIRYFKICRQRGYIVNVRTIKPINYRKPHIEKILFSIGAYASLKGIRINYPDIIEYPLCIADNSHPKAKSKREVDITNLVDYVLDCMKEMKRTLTQSAEDNLFKVIGEVLINSEEHSTCKQRYSIGYFQHSNGEEGHIGTFNLVILNFGKTIYEKFSDPDCPNKDVVKQMQGLSQEYTKKRFFQPAAFEEETLWTLYSLQEGVTSKADWKRGNGSIRFIESFFSLKGDQNRDNISYLSIVSGHTRITFDGTYRIKEVSKGKGNKTFKMMLFNETGDIGDKPDKRFVTFADAYFPGTIITARICIKENNAEIPENEHS